jgi:hypothetical protein
MKMMTYIIMLACTTVFFISCRKENSFEKEPNNDYEHATAIDINKSIKGKLSTASDIDYYFIDVAEPSSFDITVGSVKGLNIAFKICKRDLNGEIKVIKIIDDNRKSSPERMCNAWFDKGRYFIVVCFGEKDKIKGNDEDYYEMKIEIHTQDEYTEKEPNDDQKNSTEMILDKKYTGYLCPALLRSTDNGALISKEEDWYYFDAEINEGDKIVCDINLSSESGIQFKVSIRNDKLELIADNVSVSGENDMNLSGIGIRQNGRYYIIVSAMKLDSNCESPYYIVAGLHSYDYSGELEPNNRVADANVLNDNILKGYLYPSNDHDFYKIDVQGEVMLSAVGEYPEGISAGIRIYDEDGTLLYDTKSTGIGSTIMIMPFYVNKVKYLETYIVKGSGDKSNEYQIKIMKEEYTSKYEKENNDSKNMAQHIIEGSYEGYLNRAGDKDWYLLKNLDKKSIRIKLKWENDSVGKLSITDKKGYIIKTEKVLPGKEATIVEMIEDKTYILIEAEKYRNNSHYYLTVE